MYQWFEDKRFIVDSDDYNTSTGEAEQLGKYQDNTLKYKTRPYQVTNHSSNHTSEHFYIYTNTMKIHKPDAELLAVENA